jgi:hypothetical protein
LETALVESGLSYCILRPTVLFGKEDVLINNIAWAVRHLPVFGVFGSGDYRLQPIYVDDLAQAAGEQAVGDGCGIVEAIATPAKWPADWTAWLNTGPTDDNLHRDAQPGAHPPYALPVDDLRIRELKRDDRDTWIGCDIACGRDSCEAAGHPLDIWHTGDAVHIYSNLQGITLQLRHEVPTQVDLAATSFKVSVTLTPADALAVAGELLTVAAVRVRDNP